MNLDPGTITAYPALGTALVAGAYKMRFSARRTQVYDRLGKLLDLRAKHPRTWWMSATP